MAEVRESGRPAPPRRRWRLALAPLAVLASLFSAPHLSAADLPEIQTSGSLRVLVVLDAHRREFFALDVKMPGFDREIIEGFAQVRGLKVEVINLPSFDDLIPALLDHRGDIIAAGYRDSDTRRKSIAFTDEVFPEPVRRRHPQAASRDPDDGGAGARSASARRGVRPPRKQCWPPACPRRASMTAYR